MKNQIQKSVLRYPGGKSRAVNQIISIIYDDFDEVISPFFGGGSIELALASKGKKVFGNDLYSPLICFWKELFLNKNNLINEIKKMYPISKEHFSLLQKKLLNEEDSLKKAAYFFVLNRSSFSGSTMSGGFSPNHPRFTQSSIDRLSNFNVNLDISFFSEHFVDFIKRFSSDIFLYCDPPYYIKSKLYGNKGSLHTNFEHNKLKTILDERENWILSYNNCEEIQELYKDYHFLYPDWKYGMSKNKDSKEVLILSHNIKKMLSL